jgi:capsular exopolysaccharide synthesis family protein
VPNRNGHHHPPPENQKQHAPSIEDCRDNLVGNLHLGLPLTDLDPSTANLELAKLPTELAEIQAATRVVYHTDPASQGADRFRLLRMRLNALQSARKIKSLLITSPLPHDGKSTVTLNLATVLAEKGKRSVLVVEGDFHRPTLTQQLGLKSGQGLADCLANQSSLISTIRRIQPLGWYLLPAGVALHNPTELLQTGALANVMQELSAAFEWVVIDSPPVAPLADTLLLAKTADASLLIVRAGQTPRRAVDEAITLLGRQHILAVVLNGIEGLDRQYSSYGYYNRRPRETEGLI